MKTTISTILLICSLQLVVGGDELGERVVWNGAQIPPALWQTADGISVSTVDNTLVLRSSNVDYGWAATENLLPVTDTTFVDVNVRQAKNGQLNLQIEWFREDGGFIGASSILREARTGAAVINRKLADFLPEIEKPQKFRLKFWLEGSSAEMQFSKAIVNLKRSWRKPDTRLVRTYGTRSVIKSDAGMDVRPLGGDLIAKLAPETAYSALHFAEAVPLEKKAVALFDIAEVRNGSVTLQALCWDNEGNHLKAVDLSKDVFAAATFEVPLDAFKDLIPPQTTKLSFKVWLSGHETTARIAGLYYGIAP